MEVFIALFVYLLFIKAFVNSHRRGMICILAGIGLWLVLALRSPYCGIDLVTGVSGSSNYYNMFVKASSSSFFEILSGELSSISSMERGWLLYCMLASYISSYFQVFLAITALIQLILIGFIIYKYSTDIILSYIVYFCFGLYIMSFSGIRQSTAFAITFFSVHFLLNKENIKFILTVLLAASIHNSALIFLLAFPLYNMRFTSANSRIAIIGVFFLLPFLSAIINTVVPFVFGSRYNNYQDTGGAITLFLLYVIIYILSLKILIENQKDNLIRGLIVMAVACQSLGSIGSGAITRIGFYFTIFFTLLFPELVNVYSTNKNKSIMTFFMSLLLFVFFYWTNKDGYLDVIPYYFFWENPFID